MTKAITITRTTPTWSAPNLRTHRCEVHAVQVTPTCVRIYHRLIPVHTLAR